MFDKSNTITLNAGHEIDVSQIKLAAQKNLTLIAGKGITARQTRLKGENIELLAREGDIRLPMGVEDSSHISASNNVQMFASNKLDLQGVLFDKANNITLNAGHEINADRVK
ncbi:hemagglutinin repeat-containing protein, partial [Photorhabdus africana]|uniref:hemagglutinin repeat-containing protein n=1 Tax=Photorhabdus africana TaxID=3097554 RepID=UPI002B414E1D